jgi:hypothetical protein
VASNPRDEVLHFDFVFYGRLVDKNRDGCESLTNFPHPVVLLQCGDSGSDRFVEGLCRDLHRVLNVLKILDSNCARSENHEQELNMFAFYSPYTELGLAPSWQRRLIENRKPPLCRDGRLWERHGHIQPPKNYKIGQICRVNPVASRPVPANMGKSPSNGFSKPIKVVKSCFSLLSENRINDLRGHFSTICGVTSSMVNLASEPPMSVLTQPGASSNNVRSLSWRAAKLLISILSAALLAR